jgi:hypothetical protein
MKRVFLTVVIALAFVLSAPAQSPDTDEPKRFELGWNPWSYLRQEGRNLWGGGGSIAMRRSDHLSYVADISVHQTRGVDTFTTSAYRFGLRYYATPKGKFTPFAEALAGGARIGRLTSTTGTTTTELAPGSNGFSFAAGGGVNMAIRPWISWRVVQGDYSLIRAGGSSYNGVRIHTGGAFHF